jgi:hypothetical protein
MADVRARGLPISGPAIQEKADSLGHSGMPTFVEAMAGYARFVQGTRSDAGW